MEAVPLVALAPDASPEQKLPVSMDASARPVFQYIEELLLSGRISQTKAVALEAGFKLLHDTLKSAQESEVQLLGEAKRCHAVLERLRAGLVEKSAEEPSTSEEAASEVKEVRQQLLQACNALKAAEERDDQTQHQLNCLWEEKRYLEKENEILTEAAELEDKTKSAHDKFEELKKEVAQRRLEIRSLMEDLEISEMQIVREQKELRDKKEIIEFKEAERAGLIAVPDQLSKETERKRSKKEVAFKNVKALKMEISERQQEVKKVEERNQSLRTRVEEGIREAEGRRGQVEESKMRHRRLLKETQVDREKASELMGNRGILEMKLKNIMCDRKYLHENQSKQLREKSRQMQAFKRIEHALAISTEQLQHNLAVFHHLQRQLHAVPKREAGIQQKEELQKEVDALKVTFEKQLAATEEESQKKQRYGMIQELLRESNRLREELHNLRCLTQIKAEERGQKHRELLRAEQLNQRIQQELQEKDLIIADQNKLNGMLQRRIAHYSKMCDMILEEKNRYVKLKQMTSQTITELAEQLEVLQNEMEIQRSIVAAKDRSSTKARTKLSHSSKTRDKLRNDISKVAWKHRQISQEGEDTELELTRLAQAIQLQEDSLQELNASHKTTAEQRNSLGIQLLEHDEVLFNYHEKLNKQEAAITKGNMALETLEKDIRDLQLAVTEEKRQIDLTKKEVQLKRRLEGEIVTLQIELSEARDETLEGLNKTAEYKELKGTDPSAAELVKKFEQLERNLAERERQLLEKELLVEQVTRLSQPLREQVESCREDRLSLAKKLNECRSNILDTNQRLMAVSAELAMKQAATLSEQQQVKEKELQMERCQGRLDEGLPLYPEIEEEWRKMLRDKKRRQRDKEEKMRLAEEEEWKLLPNGVYTTALARPTAYIPQNDQLALPQPYGAMAPFKPSQSGGNMRHVRKPTLNSVEI